MHIPSSEQDTFSGSSSSSSSSSSKQQQRRQRRPPGIDKVLGAATSGFIELLTFHPVDTIAKRLIHHKGSSMHGVSDGSSSSTSSTSSSSKLDNLSRVVFKDAAHKSAMDRYFSLFQGFKYAVAYKVLQRTYQFGGHPFVSDYIRQHYSSDLTASFGKRNAQFVNHALAGAIIGLGEVMLLPFDLLKVRGQTASRTALVLVNNTNINNLGSPFVNSKSASSSSSTPAGATASSLFSYYRQRNDSLGALRALYRGAGWTAARNSIGCFSLFGTSALVKDKFYNLKDYSKATIGQDFMCALVASAMSILVVAPLDTIKVRIQAAPLSTQTTGWIIIKNLIKHEGPMALFKGTFAKLLVAGPKVAFGMTVAAQLSKFYRDVFDQRANRHPTTTLPVQHPPAN